MERMGATLRPRFRDGFDALATGLQESRSHNDDEQRASGPFLVALLRKSDWEVALSNLEAFVGKSGDVVCPVAIKSIKPRHRKSKDLVTTRVPLLLGYVFFRLPDGLDWRHALHLDGVQAVLHGDNEPRTIPAHVVSRLAPMKELALSWEGKTVEFVEGPLTGFWGQYLSGAVHVDFFGRVVPITSHPVNLKPK